MKIVQKIKNRTIIWSSNLTLGACGKGLCLDTAASRNLVLQDLGTDCYKLHYLLHRYLIPSGLVPDSPGDHHEARPKWGSQEASHNAGGIHIHFGLSFPTGKTIDLGRVMGTFSAVLCQPGGGVIWSKVVCSAPLNLLMWSFSVFVVQEAVSFPSLGSGIFKMASCLWIVASLSACERDWGWKQSLLSSWLHCLLYLQSFWE